MLTNELASLRTAADFLEDQGMSQCSLLRDAVKVLEFINDGGSIQIERGLLGLHTTAGEEVEFRKGRAQLHWATQVINLDLMAKQIGELDDEYNRHRNRIEQTSLRDPTQLAAELARPPLLNRGGPSSTAEESR